MDIQSHKIHPFSAFFGSLTTFLILKILHRLYFLYKLGNQCEPQQHKLKKLQQMHLEINLWPVSSNAWICTHSKNENIVVEDEI
jgi:hypothetical protein